MTETEGWLIVKAQLTKRLDCIKEKLLSTDFASMADFTKLQGEARAIKSFLNNFDVK